jgi:hypothetical protein
MGKGFAGTIFLTTDDCRLPLRAHARYDVASISRKQPEERRRTGSTRRSADPSGNHIRLTQVRELAAVVSLSSYSGAG